MRKPAIPALTLEDCNVLALFITPAGLEELKEDELPVRDSLATRGLLAVRCGLAQATNAGLQLLADAIRRESHAVRPFTGLDWAHAAVPRQCPEYEFFGSELRVARRLVADGSFRPTRQPRQFRLTFRGACRLRSQ